MIFLLTLLILSSIWFGVSFYFKIVKDIGYSWDISFYVSLFVSLIIGVMFCCCMTQRRENITDYYECKKYPEHFTNEHLINNNEVISKIKAHQGTIFSFYNGIEFEYFEIEDGSKVIIRK
jgi:hypothetical protein